MSGTKDFQLHMACKVTDKSERGSTGILGPFWTLFNSVTGIKFPGHINRRQNSSRLPDKYEEVLSSSLYPQCLLVMLWKEFKLAFILNFYIACKCCDISESDRDSPWQSKMSWLHYAFAFSFITFRCWWSLISGGKSFSIEMLSAILLFCTILASSVCQVIYLHFLRQPSVDFITTPSRDWWKPKVHLHR